MVEDGAFSHKIVILNPNCITGSRVVAIFLNCVLCLLVELQQWGVCDQRGYFSSFPGDLNGNLISGKLVPWDSVSSYRPQLYKARCSNISPVASQPCQQPDLSMELLPSASPTKLQPLKDRLQDRILNSRRELQDKICNFSPLKEDRLGNNVMMNFSNRVFRNSIKNAPVNNCGQEKNMFERTQFRNSFKDAFVKDIAILKDAVSTS